MTARPLSPPSLLALGILLPLPAVAQPGSSDPLWIGKTDTGCALTIDAWDKAFAMLRDDHRPLVLGRLETYCRERQAFEWPSDKKQAQAEGSSGGR